MADIESESFEEQPDSDLTLDQREAHRERLLNTVERMELEYDKALLVLHPLGISVTSGLLVGLLNAHAVIKDYLFLYLAWITWILGIAMTLRSFQLSAKMHRIAADEWSENREPNEHAQIKSLSYWVGRLNLWSGGALVLGITFAAIFLFQLQK